MSLKRTLTHDYIRGLVEGEGTFTFDTRISGGIKHKIPSFALSMHVRDKDLIEGVRNFLNIKNRVYVYHHPGKDSSKDKRGPKAILIIREIGSLKNKIIPLFYNQLVGNKAIQFDNWIEKIGSDKSVPKSYQILYRLCKNGFYDKNPKYFDSL
ncbi:MAG: LAGLIDADG family homing endonuclease [bacterium]|nr:LAGLIDADG family homing endonuclease [bacterium]